jgi:hypothetical protein
MKRLTVDLSAKALGKVGLAVTLSKRLDDADLKSPTGKAVDFTIPMPVVAKDTVLRREASAIVNAANYFQIKKHDTFNLQTVPVEQLRSEWRGSFTAGQLGFVFGQDNFTSLNLQIERRKPHITMRQFQMVQIEDGIAKYTSRFYYTILYSGVKSLRVDVPADVSPKFRNRTQGIREIKIEPAPENVSEGYVAWEFSGGSELNGTGMFELYWEENLDQLKTGVSIPVKVPRLIPKDVDRTYGHISISKAQTIDLGESPGKAGLEEVDLRLEPETASDRTNDVAAAFSFSGDWTLNLIATRYELQDVKRTSIEKGLARAVLVNNDKKISVQAMYQIRSVQQRLALTLPEGVEKPDLDPTINGNAVTLEIGTADGQFSIPLSSTNPDESFLLELRYSIPLDRGGRILLPTFPNEPAVQEMYVAVYVPQDRALWGFYGAWTPLFNVVANWELGGMTSRVSVNNKLDVDKLIEKMQEKTKTSSESARPFAVDGHCYLFSTLQPGDSGAAILKISTIKQTVFYVMALVLFVLFAVGMTLLNWHRRLAGVAFGVVLLLLFGMCNPTAASLLGGFESGIPAELWYAGFLTVFVWTVLACVDGAKYYRKHCGCKVPAGESQENKEGGSSHE